MKNIIITAVILALLFGGKISAQQPDSIKTRPAQLTFITPLGTNGIESPEIANALSINILGGYNGAVNGIEMGGYLNMTKYYAEGVQLSGFANINLGHLEGLQMSGFTNVNLAKTKGVQASGFGNYSGDTLEGIQAAGFANIALNRTKGLQASGFANMSTGNAEGMQVAGFANIATDTINGVQASGFVNVAKTVKGIQLGFVNIADTVDGVSIGFLSLVKHGHHAMEINVNESLFINALLKLGTEKFYNIFSIGMQPAAEFRWGPGYGIGTLVNFSDKWAASFDLMAYHINEGAAWTVELNEFYQLKVNASYEITKGLVVTSGPTFNMMISDYLGVDPKNPGSEFPIFHHYNYTTDGEYNIKMWVGMNGGIRF